MSTTLQLTTRHRPATPRLHPRSAWLPLLFLLTLTLSTAVQAQFSYTKANGAITITGYTGAGGDVIVPSTLEGLPVTYIGVAAFSSYTGLTSVTLPNSVTSIRDSAFAYCTGLTSVTLGNSVRSIGGSAFVGCTGLTRFTMSRLNHTIFDRVRSAGTIVEDLSEEEQAERRQLYLIDPDRRTRPMGPLVNPVMMKEFRCRRFGRLTWLLRLVSVCALTAVALAFLAATGSIAWDVSTIGGIFVILQVGLIVLITPSLTAGLISTERESGGWVLLQMTPMSAIRILWGKLLSVFLTLGLVLFATLPGYVMMVWIDPGQRPQIERVVICLLVTTVFATLTSAAAGCLFRQTVAATAAAYLTLIAVCTLPLLVWMGRGAPFGHNTVERALTINPVAAALSVIRFPGFREYDLIPAHWWVVGVASLVSLCVLVVQTVRLSRPQ